MSTLTRKSSQLFPVSFSGVRAFSWQVGIHSYAWSPPTDLYETDASFNIRVELAGIRETDFSIQLEDNYIIITGVRQETPEKRSYHQMEIRYGEFTTAVALPAGVDTSRIEADYQNGFLNVIMPKLIPTVVIPRG